jgi:asparagine synthase (glutamine-hydrolysing)
MCGICGWLTWDGSVPQASVVQAMTRALWRRGDDAWGVECLPGIGLGHQRLSILDVSDRANQPFVSSDKRFWLVFNGEIYNFRELRATLEPCQVFRTTGDTEVLLAGLIQRGVDFLAECNGMFAFALWDSLRRRLLLGRDRWGVKPLYYAHLDAGLLFASEIKGLRRHPALTVAVDPAAVSDYLSLGYIPGEQTVFRQIRQLLPGHFLCCDPSERVVRPTAWFDLRDMMNDPPLPMGERDEAIRSTLARAVERRLVSDVPVGSFLSGGVDSSAVTALAIASQPHLNTFSLGFPQASFDELPQATRFAARIGARSHQAVFQAPDEGALRQLAAMFDQPFADTSAVPTEQLCAFAARRMKVVLSGDGGDEWFGGYETTRADALALFGRREVPGWRMVTGLIAKIMAVIPANLGKVSWHYKVRQFAHFAGEDAARAHFSWRLLFSEDEKRRLLAPEIVRDLAGHDSFAAAFGPWYAAAADLPWPLRHVFVDVKTWLTDDILVKVDRTSMAHALEVRSPFLDPELVRVALRIPFHDHADLWRTKKRLRHALSPLMGTETRRQPKQGFSSPTAFWLTAELAPLFHRTIRTESFRTFFPDPRPIVAAWEDLRARRRDWSFCLWALLMFGLWTETCLDSAGSSVPVAESGGGKKA